MEITGGTPFNGEQGTGNIDFQIYHSEDFNHNENHETAVVYTTSGAAKSAGADRALVSNFKDDGHEKLHFDVKVVAAYGIHYIYAHRVY